MWVATGLDGAEHIALDARKALWVARSLASCLISVSGGNSDILQAVHGFDKRLRSFFAVTDVLKICTNMESASAVQISHSMAVEIN